MNSLVHSLSVAWTSPVCCNENETWINVCVCVNCGRIITMTWSHFSSVTSLTDPDVKPLIFLTLWPSGQLKTPNTGLKCGGQASTDALFLRSRRWEIIIIIKKNIKIKVSQNNSIRMQPRILRLPSKTEWWNCDDLPKNVSTATKKIVSALCRQFIKKESFTSESATDFISIRLKD